MKGKKKIIQSFYKEFTARSVNLGQHRLPRRIQETGCQVRKKSQNIKKGEEGGPIALPPRESLGAKHPVFSGKGSEQTTETRKGSRKKDAEIQRYKSPQIHSPTKKKRKGDGKGRGALLPSTCLSLPSQSRRKTWSWR